MGSEVKEQLSMVEKTLNDFIKHTNLSFINVHNSILELKLEMAEFKDEMAEFKDEMRMQTAQLNKKWGELSNRLGTLAEDFAAPNLPYIAEKYFGCSAEPEDFMLRRRRHLPGSVNGDSRKEFDVIVVYAGHVFYNETKSTPRPQYIDDFVENIKLFFDYFPEYKGHRLIPVFSSLSLDESVVKNCTNKGIYAMALKGDTMDLLNFAELET